MLRTTWAFWILLILFIGNVIDMLLRVCGRRATYSWDADSYDRVIGVILCIMFAAVYAIALGWIR